MHLLKICVNSICRPLKIIFICCITNGKFTAKWKKANIVSIYKKGDKEILKSYWPMSLLSISEKVFCVITIEQLDNDY